MKPQYPVYVISKGRFENCLTAKFLIKDKVDFNLVVEPQEADEYIKRFGAERVLILPFSNLGLGSIPARNWVWEDSKKKGFKRHWILDDNIRSMKRRYKAIKIVCNANAAFKAMEDFVERYENIAIAGTNYTFFAADRLKMAPFYLNNHVYSCLLILNSLEYRWRGRYNEDTDLCLQVLSGGWCTVLFNSFLIEKMATMTMKGGNSDQLYKGDGRLKMARSLERQWPGVATTDRRFGRPQHKIKDEWRKFDTKLIRRKDLDWSAIENTKNEYGLELKQVGENLESETLKSMLDSAKRE